MAKRLLLLNGVAILCVVLFHATGWGFTAMFSWAHRYRPVISPNYDDVGSGAYFVLRLVEQFVVFSIPAFLFVSGFFVSVLAGRHRKAVDPRAIGARIRSLLIPYAVWSGIVLVALAAQGRVLPGAEYLRLILTGATGPNYYYVPLLVQLYLVAPLIVLAARRNWKVLLGVTGALQVSVYLLQYMAILGWEAPLVTPLAAALPKWFFPVHVFWFALGIVVGFEHQALRPVLARRRWILLTSAVVLYVLGVVEWELLLGWSGQEWVENRVTLVDGCYAGALIFAYLAFAEVELPFAQPLMALGARSFGIYLVHSVAMEYFSRGIYHLAPWVLSSQLLFQPMVIAVALLVPLLLMSLVSRSPARRFYSYVFG